MSFDTDPGNTMVTGSHTYWLTKHRGAESTPQVYYKLWSALNHAGVEETLSVEDETIVTPECRGRVVDITNLIMENDEEVPVTQRVAEAAYEIELCDHECDTWAQAKAATKTHVELSAEVLWGLDQGVLAKDWERWHFSHYGGMSSLMVLDSEKMSRLREADGSENTMVHMKIRFSFLVACYSRKLDVRRRCVQAKRIVMALDTATAVQDSVQPRFFPAQVLHTGDLEGKQLSFQELQLETTLPEGLQIAGLIKQRAPGEELAGYVVRLRPTSRHLWLVRQGSREFGMLMDDEEIGEQLVQYHNWHKETYSASPRTFLNSEQHAGLMLGQISPVKWLMPKPRQEVEIDEEVTVRTAELDYDAPVALVDQLISSVAEILTPGTANQQETEQEVASPSLNVEDSSSEEEVKAAVKRDGTGADWQCPARYCEPIRVSKFDLSELPAIGSARPLECDSQVLRMICSEGKWYFVIVSNTAKTLSRLSWSRYGRLAKQHSVKQDADEYQRWCKLKWHKDVRELQEERLTERSHLGFDQQENCLFRDACGVWQPARCDQKACKSLFLVRSSERVAISQAEAKERVMKYDPMLLDSAAAAVDLQRSVAAGFPGMVLVSDSEDEETDDELREMVAKKRQEGRDLQDDSSEDDEIELEDGELLARALKVCEENGVVIFDSLRVPTQWSQQQVREVVQTKSLVGGLPLQQEKQVKCMGWKGLRFIPLFDEDALKCSSQEERWKSYVAADGALVGEAITSIPEDYRFAFCVAGMAKSGGCDREMSDAIAEKMVFTSAKTLQQAMMAVEDPCAMFLRVKDSALREELDGRNLAKETPQEFYEFSGVKRKVKDEDESLRLLRKEIDQMKSCGGILGDEGKPRDFFAHFSHETEAQAAAPKTSQEDIRPKLSPDLAARGFKRCLIVTCMYNVEPGEKVCMCGAVAPGHNVCEHCTRGYDPNFEFRCRGCRRAYPHSTEYHEEKRHLEMMSVWRKQGGEEGSQNGTKSIETVKRLSADRRMNMVVRSGTKAGSYAVVDFQLGKPTVAVVLHELLEQSKRCSLARMDITFVVPGVKMRFTAGVLKFVSEARFGSPGVGFSVFQCMPLGLNESRDSSHFFNHKNTSKVKDMTETECKALVALSLSDDGVEMAMKQFGKCVEFLLNKELGQYFARQGEILMAWRKSIPISSRDTLASCKLLLRLLDFLGGLLTQYTEAVVSATYAPGFNPVSVVSNLKLEFPYLAEKILNCSDLPLLELRTFCSLHVGKMDQADAWSMAPVCGCKWSPMMQEIILAGQHNCLNAFFKSMNHAYEGMAAAYGGKTVVEPVSGSGQRQTTKKVRFSKIKFEENRAPWWEPGDHPHEGSERGRHSRDIPDDELQSMRKDYEQKEKDKLIMKKQFSGHADLVKHLLKHDRYDYSRMNAPDFRAYIMLRAYNEFLLVGMKLSPPMDLSEVCPATLSYAGCCYTHCKLIHESDDFEVQKHFTAQVMRKNPALLALLRAKCNGVWYSVNGRKYGWDEEHHRKKGHWRVNWEVFKEGIKVLVNASDEKERLRGDMGYLVRGENDKGLELTIVEYDPALKEAVQPMANFELPNLLELAPGHWSLKEVCGRAQEPLSTTLKKVNGTVQYKKQRNYPPGFVPPSPAAPAAQPAEVKKQRGSIQPESKGGQTVAQQSKVFPEGNVKDFAMGRSRAVRRQISVEQVFGKEPPLFGGVPVEECFALEITANIGVEKIRLRGVVHNLGEHVEGDGNQCYYLQEAATHRVPEGPAHCRKMLKKGAKTLVESTDTLVWERVLAEFQGELTEEVIESEADACTHVLAAATPVIPLICTICCQEYAQEHAALMIFHQSNDDVTMHLALPSGAVDQDGDIKDVPVVVKYYYGTHAYAMELSRFEVKTDDNFVLDKSLIEDREAVDDSWQGLKLGDLWQCRSAFRAAFNLSAFVSRTTEQTLERSRLAFPPGVAQFGVFPADHLTAAAAMGSTRRNSREMFIARGRAEKEQASMKTLASLLLVADHKVLLGSQFAGAMRNSISRQESGEEVLEPEAEVVEQAAETDGAQSEMQATREEIGERWVKLQRYQVHVRLQRLNAVLICGSRMKLLQKEWEEFNSFNVQEVTQLMTAVGRKGQRCSQIVPPVKISDKAAFKLLCRAVKAVVVLQEEVKGAPQDGTDPGMRWLMRVGDCMAEVVKWAEVVFRDRPAQDRYGLVEEIFRAVEHPGRTTGVHKAEVIQDHFSSLPEALKKELHEIMSQGVDTGIPKLTKESKAKPTKAALSNVEKVWEHLRKFTKHGWVRAYPPSTRDVRLEWGGRVSAAHYVEATEDNKDRFVGDYGRPGDLEEGQDANSVSADLDWMEVQCDYVDVIAEQLAQWISALLRGQADLESWSGEDLEIKIAAIKADIKSAFLTVPLRISSIGTLCVEWFGWLFCFVRTPFGWKYATHTWSVFPRAIKHKVEDFKLAGWRNIKSQLWPWMRFTRRIRLINRLKMELRKDEWRLWNLKEDEWRLVVLRALRTAAAVWRKWKSFAYVDDFYCLTQILGVEAMRLNHTLDKAGALLLGKDGWSYSKAAEDGFFAWLQKMTGIVFNTSDINNVTVSFTLRRFVKLKEKLKIVTRQDPPDPKGVPLEIARSVHGNIIWVIKVYRWLKSFAAPWRRCLQGVPATADNSELVNSAQPGEDLELAAEKMKKDALMIEQFCDYMIQLREREGEDHPNAVVTLTVMRDPVIMLKENAIELHGSFGGDASGRACSVVCHRLKEVLVVPFPKALQQAIKDLSAIPVAERSERHYFMISLVEHLVLLVALVQYGSRWKAMGIAVAFYFTDNKNSRDWAKNQFANNPVAQEMCRFISMMQAILTLTLMPLWLATRINTLGDLTSRLLDEDGNFVPSQLQAFEEVNATLQQPYKIVGPSEDTRMVLRWFEEATTPDQVVQPLRVCTERLSMLAMPVGAEDVSSTAEQLSAQRESFTVKDAMKFCTQEDRAGLLTFSSIGSGALVGLMGWLMTGQWAVVSSICN